MDGFDGTDAMNDEPVNAFQQGQSSDPDSFQTVIYVANIPWVCLFLRLCALSSSGF